MTDNINLQKTDFKLYTCPKHVDKKILWSINYKNKMLRMRYILVPSLLAIWILFGMRSFLPYFSTSNLTNQNKDDLNIVLDLFEESILEAQQNIA